MQQIPAAIQNQYEALLKRKVIPKENQYNYKKWLRYYLDFCYKYKHLASNKSNLSHCIKKLQEKNQSIQNQKHATHAISLYYELGLYDPEKEIPAEKKAVPQISENSAPKFTNADWTSAYNDLNGEIKIRHYSVKTLRAYTGWGNRTFLILSASNRIWKNNSISRWMSSVTV